MTTRPHEVTIPYIPGDGIGPEIMSATRAVMDAAVLLSTDDWSAIQETLYLLAVPGMRESIKAGMAEPLATSSKALEW